MAEVVKLREEDDQEIIKRFRKWWPKQDKETKQAIREIVNGELSPEDKARAEEILDFLNLKTGRNYRPVHTNLKFIKARLDSGVTPEDLKAVIAKKCRDWTGDEKMSAYLRPATLFNQEKFEQYLGELE